MIPKSNRYGVVYLGEVVFTGNKKELEKFKREHADPDYKSFDGAYNWKLGDKLAV